MPDNAPSDHRHPDYRHPDHAKGLLRPLACALAVLATPLVLPFVAIWISIGPSPSGLGYLVGFSLIYLGMLTAPWRRTRFRGVTRAGLALVAVALAVRLVAADAGETMELERVGAQNVVADYANRVVPESDSALVGGKLILLATRFIDDETGELLPAMNEGYRLMRRDQGLVPSPWAATYLGLQDSRSFDMQAFEADGDRAVIFLHGYGGNFTMPCWEVAQSAREAGYATFCPSTDRRGRWWMPDSVRIIHRTIELVRQRGYRHIVLAGLSNGGIGLSRVAGQFRRDVRGFIFISGVSQSAKPVRRKSLVVHGDRDEMTATSVARGYAKRSLHGEYAEFEGGHFVLIEHRGAVRARIAAWLAAL